MKKYIVGLLALLMAFPASAATISVQRGDTLSQLAATYHTTVSSIVAANGIKNPRLIYPGESLTIDSALGAVVPTVVALFQDSLASSITNSATTFTLVRGTDGQSRNLSGFYGFVMDEGSASSEFFTANCVATACTIVARGIDLVDGKTAVASLKLPHRRGASVKITNFPQLAILSRILSGLESASSTFSFGDGTTSASKCLRADNGTSNLPKVCYNEITQKWTAFDDGLNSYNLNAAAGGLGASTTAATFITNSLIGIYASSSAAANGGYLKIAPQANGTSAVYFDSPTFNATTQTFSNINGTSTALQLNFTPTNSLDGVNKNYSDAGSNYSYATGTVGVAVTAGQALYVSATSTKLALTSASATGTSWYFVGIAAQTAAANATINFIKPGSIADNLTGLSAGKYYYLSNTDGSLSLAPGTIAVRVGLALSANRMQVLPPGLHMRVAGATTGWAAASVTVSLGFIPTRVDFMCGSGANWSQGTWQGLSNGGSAQQATGIDGGTLANAQSSATDACKWRESSNTFTGTMTTTTGGFIMTTNNLGASRAINYIATYDSNGDLGY